jgi:hypothetical protein
MLILGSVSGFFGFVFVFVIGVLKAFPEFGIHTEYCYRVYDDHRLKPCYFPATVSEMVCDSREPSGRVFWFFEFVGAILIFFSWYPTSLRNVYIGDDSVACCNISWVALRQYVPAPGMMMLSAIPTVPAAQADVLDYFCIGLHLFGAMLMFVGYFVVEAVAIGWGPCAKVIPEHKRHYHPKALFARKLLVTGIIFFYVVFCVIQVVLSVGTAEEGFDHWDIWKNCTDLPNKTANVDCTLPQLIEAADWKLKKLKVASFGSEVFCGLCVIGSHCAVWYYCEERHYDLPEELKEMTSTAASVENTE